MPRADVVVVGAGLAGLTAAAYLAEAGASVYLVAKGHATTHWAGGGIDIAIGEGAATPRDALAALAARPSHPYALLGGDVPTATSWLLERLAAEGLPYKGDLDAEIRRVPTSIGGTRRVAIVPDAQSAALRSWGPSEALAICGPAGFKDFWPAAIASSLERPIVWRESPDRPARVRGTTAALPGLAERHNLNALELARRFDDPAWRSQALDAIARALETLGFTSSGGGRVGLPAMLGLRDHAAALEAARRRLPVEPFEIPLVPPSVPGIRLFGAFRERIRRPGGRIQIGEWVARIERDNGRVTTVQMEAAARTFAIRTDALILATGGIAGGGIVATPEWVLEEPLLGLPVEAPPPDRWLTPDALDPAGQPLESAGIRVDAEMRPIDPSSGRPAVDNVRVVGALLAGQRGLRERCGDGVALTSGWRAARELAAVPAGQATEARAER